MANFQSFFEENWQFDIVCKIGKNSHLTDNCLSNGPIIHGSRGEGPFARQLSVKWIIFPGKWIIFQDTFLPFDRQLSVKWTKNVAKVVPKGVPGTPIWTPKPAWSLKWVVPFGIRMVSQAFLVPEVVPSWPLDLKIIKKVAR